MASVARRLPAALLVALATALVLGGLLGTVSAASDGPGGKSALRLPSPAIGDRWTYQAVVEGPWYFGPNDEQRAGTPFAYAEFAWLDPVLVRDAAGMESPADVVHAKRLAYYDDPDAADFNEGRNWIPTEARYLYRLGAPEAFARESQVTSEQGTSAGAGIGVVGGIALLQTGTTEVLTGWSRGFDPTAHAPCLARSPMQGGRVDLDATLRLPRNCMPEWGEDPWDDEEIVFADDEGYFPGERGEFRFAARETVAGHQAHRFDGDGESIWLAADVPVPIQWTRAAEGRTFTLTLSSYVSGAAPLGSLGPVAGPSVAPGIAMGPRFPWGPDDSGVDHPFPASTAYQAALDDPTFPKLREWQAAHPDGATFLLEYSEDLEHMPPERTWFFAVADGRSSVLAFVVSQVDQPGPVPAPPQVTELEWLAMYLGGFAPDAASMPDEVPTVASTLARWRSYEELEGRDSPSNGWGMSIMCLLDCAYGTFGNVVAGRDPVAMMHMDFGDMGTGARPSEVTGRTFTGSQLEAHVWTGETQSLVNWTGYDTGLTVSPLAGQSPVDPTPGPGAGGTDRPLVATFLPSPEQGAAITAASAVAGLLYWLWPTLKGGAAGLFSRLTGPRLLDHPARARLVQLVQAEPGIHFQDLVRRSGMANGTAVHHLHKLADAGLVSSRPLGRYTCYFPGASPDRATLAAAPVTRSEGARRILAELAAHPGISGIDLADRLGVRPSTITYHVKRLQDAGLVATARDGRVIRLRAVAGAA